MIANPQEYQTAQDELRLLEERLRRLQEAHPGGWKGFTKAGVRKMMARLHDDDHDHPPRAVIASS